MLYPSVGEKFYLKLLLLHTAPRSFVLARTAVHKSFQAATQALGLLDDEEWVLPSTTEMLAGDIGNGWSTSEKPVGEQRKYLDGRLQ